MNNSIKFKRRLNHFLTYFYLVALSIIIICPLTIQISTRFYYYYLSSLDYDYVCFQDRECPCV